MNLNIYKRHKSFFLQAQHKEKLPSKAYSNAVAAHRANELLTQAKQYYHSQTNLEKAVDGFEKFLEVYPEHDEALYLCAVSEVQISRFESAILKFERISQAYSLKQNALLLASIAENKLGNISKSFRFVNECLRRSPRYEQALCFRGKLNLQTNNFIKAELDFKNVVSINESSYLGFIGLADCCKFAYKYEMAIELYQRSLDLIEDLKEADKINMKQIRLKMGICYYLLERYGECQSILTDLSVSKDMKTSQLFYYLGLTEIQLNNREKGLNHLQYSIRLQTNTLVIEKAFKKLILLYLTNQQFYQAQTLSKLSDLYPMKVTWWKQLIDSFMLVIRNDYEEGLAGINRIYELMKADKHTANELKIKDKDKKIDDFIFKSPHISNLFKRKTSVLRSSERIKGQRKPLERSSDKQRKYPLLPIKRSIDKIESLRLNTYNYQSFPLKLGRFKTEYQQPDSDPPIIPPFTDKQKQVLFPILLRFKAYCQFFTDKIINSSETIEQYELYIQDLLGKESDIQYSKALCEILMFVQSEELDDALLKCNEAINIHFGRYGFDNILPFLYKIAVLIRMAIVSILKEQENKQESYQILILTLEMIEEKDILKTHPLTHYFKGIIYILVDDYRSGQESLSATIRLAETGTSSILYMKGLVEMRLGKYLIAFKEISGSLLSKKTGRAFLARAIILYYLSESKEVLNDQVSNLVLKSQNSQIQFEQIIKKGNLTVIKECIVEKCLDDLQNYIDLCENDDEIPTWVTKVLFACRSFDEVVTAIQKVTVQSVEMDNISECLSIYSGDFEKGGKAGLTIKSALDGQFLSKKQEQVILSLPLMKTYSKEQFDYLQGGYQKWLVLLHLYMKQQYQLCIRYLQKILLECGDQQQELLLRFNLAFIYFLTEDHEKGIQLFKSLSVYQDTYRIGSLIQRVVDGDFVEDECLGDLTAFLHLRASKMLSNYLPYRSIYLLRGTSKVLVFGRISVPFPNFPTPPLNLEFDINFILAELDLHKVPKSMEAPWIKRCNQSIQFTDSMQDTIVQFQSKPSEQGGMALPLKALSRKQKKQITF